MSKQTLRTKMWRGAAFEALSGLLIVSSVAAAADNGSSAEIADRRVRNAIFGDAFLAENVQGVRRRVAGMSAADRFAFLRQWILPESAGEASHGFRIGGEFTQTQPAPILERRTEAANAGQGAELVSPVYDLLDVARELGKLEVLRSQVEAIPDFADEDQQRAKLALLILIHLERRDRDAAAEIMDQFYSLAVAATPRGIADLWPQTLVVHRAASREGGRELIGDLLGLLYQRHAMRMDPNGIEFWHTHIAAWMARHQHLVTGNAAESFEAPDDLQDWVPVVRARARSRGVGHALARWRRNGAGEVHHLYGHQEEYLFYRSPLRGNFDITSEIGAYGSTQVLAAGTFCGPVSDGGLLEVGAFRRGVAGREPIDPPLGKFDAWVQYRASFRDGVCTVYLNGRPVRTIPLPEHYDPWFGVRSWWRNGGRFRNVVIGGEPEVPEEVVLSAPPDLAAWLPYHEESIGYPGARWQHVADPESTGWIVGRRGANLAGAFSESLLTYQRPLIEDGSIEYEFFYQPGEFEVCPAMDRLAFLLRPDGVRLHWITNAPFDSTDLSPDNVMDEPQNRRGPAALPLKPAAWNRLRLNMTGRTLSLTLNGQLIYQRELEAANRRTFGLFHYAGDSEVRVRNVVMRGDWPRSVPAASEQELADPLVVSLDAGLPRLKSVFKHDFVQDGLDAEYFQVRASPGAAQVSQRPDGLHVVRPATGAWASAEVAARFIARGDFDLVAEFDQFETSGDKDACIVLVARLADEPLHHCRALRNRIPALRQVFQTSLSSVDRNGKRNYVTKQFACEATSGRLRVARRGNEVFYLFAEADSPTFRLFGKEVVSTADTLPAGIDVSAIANGTATVSAVWKNLRIAAEELLLLPDPSAKPKNLLFVMNVDGTGLNQLTPELPEFPTHGSPDWSPDGKRIAFDAWTGTADSSHLFLVNADGSGLKDLGVGVMPTFSPDGRRLAFTWSSQGIAVMDIDGANREVLSEEGWGAQWSPDGKWIAYESRQNINGQSVSNITIIDVKTRRKRLLLEGDHASRYSQVFWNMEWSPDSRRLAFKGNLRVPVTGAASEMALTAVQGSTRGFQVLTLAQVQTDFSWHPDGRRILLSMNSAAHGGNRLFVCDVPTGEISLLPNQPLDQHNTSGVWSPDGKRIVFSSQRSPKPLVWRPNEAK
jgi:Tol biopolymer transport system component